MSPRNVFEKEDICASFNNNQLVNEQSHQTDYSTPTEIYDNHHSSPIWPDKIFLNWTGSFKYQKVSSTDNILE